MQVLAPISEPNRPGRHGLHTYSCGIKGNQSCGSSHMLHYQKIIVMKAHEAFQRRLRQVEIELAEAQHALELLDMKTSVVERKTAVVMALQHALPDDLVFMIIEKAYQ